MPMDGRGKSLTQNRDTVVVIGAGIAGLSAALRLSVVGINVILLERHAHLGGKIRTVPSVAGPVAAGPTVLTMRSVFDDLFSFAGQCLEDHVDLIQQEVIARHFWPDGSSLDLFHDHEASVEAIRAFSNDTSADEFRTFCQRARQLFEAFELPMMHSANPNPYALTSRILAQPSLIPVMAPFSTLQNLFSRSFSDPRLRQLFGRYATYIGGAPSHAPAVLALIWHAEASGVWAVEGGISALTLAIGRLLTKNGADIRTNCHVSTVVPNAGHGYTVELENGQSVSADIVLHAGDPRALSAGLLGQGMTTVAAGVQHERRSFSARVHSFAATPIGKELSHHNVFFAADPDSEFKDLMADQLPTDPSIYVCAMDRGLDRPVPRTERFEIITNAPALPGALEDTTKWHPTIMQRMAGYGLTFDPMPSSSTVTTETMFSEMFPGSLGALYGQSPHGLLASFRRPTARTKKPGLYLAGGGCHPGAGVPMAAISGKHAAEAILNDRISASMSKAMATHGGT